MSSSLLSLRWPFSPGQHCLPHLTLLLPPDWFCWVTHALLRHPSAPFLVLHTSAYRQDLLSIQDGLWESGLPPACWPGAPSKLAPTLEAEVTSVIFSSAIWLIQPEIQVLGFERSSGLSWYFGAAWGFVSSGPWQCWGCLRSAVLGAGGMGAAVHRREAAFPEPSGSSASPCQRAGGTWAAWSTQPAPAPALAWGDAVSWAGGCHLLPPPKQPLTSQALNLIPLPPVRHHLLITHNCSMLQIHRAWGMAVPGSRTTRIQGDSQEGWGGQAVQPWSPNRALPWGPSTSCCAQIPLGSVQPSSTCSSGTLRSQQVTVAVWQHSL